MEEALVALTAVLVVTTAIYAWFTRDMAREMRQTRLLSVRPRVALDVVSLGPTAGTIALRSLGPGTALLVSVDITYRPSGAVRAWQTPVFSPGESAQFFAAGASGAGELDFNKLAAQSVSVSVSGTMRDVLGTEHAIQDSVDPGEWWNVVIQADQRNVQRADERAVSELEKIRKAIEKKCV